MHRHLAKLIALGVALALPTAAHAADAERGWAIKATAAAFQPTSAGELDSSLGFGLAFEYRASPRIGVELSAFSADIESSATLGFVDPVNLRIESSLPMTPVLLGLNFHLTPGRRVDFYGGPLAGYVRYGDFELSIRPEMPEVSNTIPNLTQTFPTDDGFAWGAHLGLDVDLGGGRAFLTAGAAYLAASTDVDFGDGTTETADVDPLVFRLGVGVRF